MKTAGKIAIGAIAGLGVILGGAALAHGHGMDHGMMGAGGKLCDPAARVDEHLASLKDRLKLKSQQTDAWQSFETAVRAQAQAQGMAQGRASKDRAAETGTDAMEARIAFMEQRLAGMKTVLKARNDLYAVLTPEQKTVADKLMQHGSHFGPHR